MYAYPDDVCLLVTYTPTVILSAVLYDVCLPMMLARLYYVMFSYQCNVCSSESLLPTCTVWCPPTCLTSVPMISDFRTKCLAICIMSVYLYDVCIPIWCRHTCMMSAYLYHVWLQYPHNAWFPGSCVWLPVWCPITYIMSVYPYYVW